MSPIGMTEFGASRNHDRAEVLIANECEIGRIDDRTRLRPALTFGTVTGLATGGVNLRAVAGTSSGSTGIRGSACARISRTRPALVNTGDQQVDLAVSQGTAGALRKRWHRRVRNSLANHAAHCRVIDNREINGIVHRDGRTGLSVNAVAACTVLAI